MKQITFQNVEEWAGSDAKKEDLIDILCDIANGTYSPEQLRQDINDYDFDESHL